MARNRQSSKGRYQFTPEQIAERQAATEKSLNAWLQARRQYIRPSLQDLREQPLFMRDRQM